MPETLTTRQQEILDFIRETIETDGIAPSMREIAGAFGFRSPKAATDHVRTLQRKGYIRLHADKARGIELLQTAGIPVIGRVAAGAPIEAIAHYDEHIALPTGLFSPKPDYLLRVQGDSMRDAHIMEGDLVAVKKTTDAESGQIVVARLEDEVTVKRLRINRASITLIAENPDYAPIRIRHEDFALEGVVCGIIRRAIG